MSETLSVLPSSFWVALALLLGGVVWALSCIRQGLGLPALAVLATVGAWYIGDAFYNDYAHNHATKFRADVLVTAWWQVACFLIVYLLFTPVMHGLMNGDMRRRSSQVYRLVLNGPMEPRFQLHLRQLFRGTAIAWAVLVAIACLRLGDQIPYYFFPFLGYRADPWGRGQIGSGFSALLSLASYFQMFLAAMFGLVAALARDPRVRFLALIGCCLSWPNYIFDRTRNTLLAVVVPGILAWAAIRLRVNWLLKLAVLAGCFYLVNVWLAFIIANRSETTIVSAAQGEGVSLKEASQEARHEGLNMFEELCWINAFIANGAYKPNWGSRYFAELVNPIPRSLWPGKPLIGLDYAVARGQGTYDDGSATATISTGMIGQGVVNFGPWLGSAFAAWLMACWTALLARLDLRGEEMGNIGLYALGMIITFNLGRDITLITLYTFFFGWALVWWIKRKNAGQNSDARSRRQRSRSTNHDLSAAGTTPAPASQPLEP
ncbi:MAG: hypothetical protein WCH99_00180 [Verrucomicrobiota bacterium]